MPLLIKNERRQLLKELLRTLKTLNFNDDKPLGLSYADIYHHFLMLKAKSSLVVPEAYSLSQAIMALIFNRMDFPTKRQLTVQSREISSFPRLIHGVSLKMGDIWVGQGTLGALVARHDIESLLIESFLNLERDYSQSEQSQEEILRVCLCGITPQS